MRIVTQLYFVDGELEQVNTKGGNWLEPERVELMQFTGLKDENGDRQWYEGDILGRGNSKRRAVITFDDGMFYADEQGERCNLMQMLVADFEVIGNIYENPELQK